MPSTLAPKASTNQLEDNKENSFKKATNKSKTKRRSTMTSKEFQELRAGADLESEESKQQMQKQQQQQQKQKQQRRRSCSLLSGIDPTNIIFRDSSASTGGGQTPSPTSPAESQIERANALNAEIDRIFDKSAAPSLRRSLRRKSFSISWSNNNSTTKTTTNALVSLAKQQLTGDNGLASTADVIDPALVQLYRQEGTYKPPPAKGLGTIPEQSTSGRPFQSTTRRRFIDFDSPARLGMKDRSRCRKAQKLLAGGGVTFKPKKSTATAAAVEPNQQMNMDEFKAYVDGLNLLGDC